MATISFLDLAMPTIWLHEGRLSDNKKDPGGITNYGISLRFLLKTGDLDNDGWPDGDIDHDGDIDAEDIKKMTKEQAQKIYDLYFWSKYKYERIVPQSIATKVFDLSVNMGSVGAHKCLQRACRAAIGIKLLEDGILGQNTLNVTNNCNSDKLLAAIKSEAAGYYRSIKYAGSQDFLSGWLNRAYSDPVLKLSTVQS